MNSLKIKEIIKIKKENQYVKTFFFKYDENIKPGQFFMIWIPNVDEIPMSVSYIKRNIAAITFRDVGDATNKLFNFKIGDKIGIRGPYGNGFKLNREKIIFIGGGTGIATLAPAIENAYEKKINIKIIIGFKNKNELFYDKRNGKLINKIYDYTNEGSIGYHGNVTD